MLSQFLDILGGKFKTPKIEIIFYTSFGPQSLSMVLGMGEPKFSPQDIFEVTRSHKEVYCFLTFKFPS